jgi:hypothetical protein
VVGFCRRVCFIGWELSEIEKIEEENFKCKYAVRIFLIIPYVGNVLERWGIYAFGSRLKRGKYGISDDVSEEDGSFPDTRLFRLLRLRLFVVVYVGESVVSGGDATVLVVLYEVHFVARRSANLYCPGKLVDSVVMMCRTGDTDLRAASSGRYLRPFC